ncbi:GL20857 [Drosophila persimilis]|uniref:GL20857 n=1 Tax=Drosophila persimilis TaxID=7234 RepID=B4H4D4_DROPE|nr:GL20857 [Drosophila persimilis]
MLLKVQSCDVFQVQPVLVKKQPKFPTRERHMAIRRKKSTAMVTSTAKPATTTTTTAAAAGGEQRQCGDMATPQTTELHDYYLDEVVEEQLEEPLIKWIPAPTWNGHQSSTR